MWNEMIEDGCCKRKDEVMWRVYLGGVAHSIRSQVWPYLLGHYSFGSTTLEREKLDKKVRNPMMITLKIY